MPLESFYVMNEAANAFINGLDIATVMLAQSFIEHRLQGHLQSLGDFKGAGRGLKAIVERLLVLQTEHEYVLGLVDDLRRFRNPFTHLRPPSDPDTLMQRVMQERVAPETVLEQEARQALAVMYQVATTRF